MANEGVYFNFLYDVFVELYANLLIIGLHGNLYQVLSIELYELSSDPLE